MDDRAQERIRRLKEQNRKLRRALDRQRRNARRLRHSALHDTLTSLPNRALLMDRLERCVARAAREEDYCFAVLFLDIDDFKFINDSFGHEVGDAVLLETARRLNRSLRGLDTVSRSDNGVPAAERIDGSARLGGDEFVVVLDGVAKTEDILHVAQRLQHHLAEPIRLPGRELAITTSMGISLGRGANLAVADLLREADAAMYGAKTNGKGGHALYDGGMQAAARRRQSLEDALHEALDRQELEVVYQPIVCLKEARVRGFEALLRWHRMGEAIGPAEFITVAEQTGLIMPIQRWVLDQVIRQVRRWNQSLATEARVWGSVNISGRQLEDPAFADEVLTTLEAQQLPAELLKLELKLGCVQRRTETWGALQRLREPGVEICVDDFGTEPLSLVEMSRLPVDVVKIDRALASVVESNRDWSAVVQAMTSLAHAMRKQVVVVGIECSQQMEQVERLNCDFAQGHFFARPLPAAAASKFIQSPPRWRLSA